MRELDRVSVAKTTGAIENNPRGIKPSGGIEKCQARSATAPRNHLAFAIRALLRFEIDSYSTG
jgi:hypothetical protein